MKAKPKVKEPEIESPEEQEILDKLPRDEPEDEGEEPQLETKDVNYIGASEECEILASGVQIHLKSKVASVLDLSYEARRLFRWLRKHSNQNAKGDNLYN